MTIYVSLVICPMVKVQQSVFPPLAQSDYLRDNQKASIKGIKNGMSGEIVVNGITYNSVMSPLGLTDKEVADVLNYINNSWGNNYGNFVTSGRCDKNHSLNKLVSVHLLTHSNNYF
jgi:hypothetical protein